MPVQKVQVTSLSGDQVCVLDDANSLTLGQVREAVGTALGKPAECVKLISQMGGASQNGLLVNEEQTIESLLPLGGTLDVVQLQCLEMIPKYFLKDHRWEYVELNFPGKEPEVLQGSGMAVRADIILWDDHWERWDWKQGPALVNTSQKTPRFHSPGVTPGALDYAVQGCNNDRPCEVVVVSEGWNNEDPDPEIHIGQLPVMDEARELMQQKYPDIELITMHGKLVAKEFNKQVRAGKAVVLLMHATC